ncbi:ferritin-like domain-containing protein [Thermococcus barophilus]|uniref:Rubrerythrin diiron-binding domain-containing protein n=1 Tax=Thermococcus barophilus (strain DSM 11836 / MP) TaxID=391623 RepID=F0LM07_THEBM|nr:ferritin family protein [Thermococcus barophilus]ADT85106.1 hypothetical protein TERMP_02132 [Thermococcus barophilus MP]
MERFEIDREVEEKVDQILQKLVKLPLEKILSYALKGEEDAIQLYKFLSQHIEEPHAKMKFEQFIKIESGHKKKIRKVFEELFPGVEPSEIPLPSWVEVSFQDVRKDIKTAEDYLSILKVAISSEKLAEKSINLLPKLSSKSTLICSLHLLKMKGSITIFLLTSISFISVPKLKRICMRE